MKYLVFTLLAFIVLSCTKSTTHRIAKIPEASGISYCKDSDTLVVASDEGHYYEIDREGLILSDKKLGKYDLEGVVCSDDGFIFAIEDKGLLWVNRKNGKMEKVTFDLTYHNQMLPLFDKNSGVEGIAKSGDLLYLAKQAKKKKDSFIAVIRFGPDQGKIIDLIKPKIPDIAGLTIHNDALYMVSDEKDLLIQYDLKKKKSVLKIKLPESAQEGIAYDSKGFVYIADDNGYILKFSEKELGL